MLGYEKEQRSLTREQKQAVGLLSIGTFLEYFDLMLYVHMSIVLNELFFPKSDPHTVAVYSALTFCSTFAFRPIGAIIFGWIGDNIGRKSTIIITTMLMALSCFIIANLAPFSQIGVTAAYLLTICRAIQGISSVGEVVGASLYLTEITEPPIRYPVVCTIAMGSALGGSAALAVSWLFTSYGFNWRLAFWFGLIIGLIGAVARTALRETPDFADAKRRLKKILEEKNSYSEKLFKENKLINEKVNVKTVLALFLIYCAWPACFYFVFVQCGNILKDLFGYTNHEVIQHNFFVALVKFCAIFVFAYASYKVHPLKIIKVRTLIFSLFILYLLYNTIYNNPASTPIQLFIIQSFVIVFGFGDTPALPVFLMYFPIFKRFTCTSLVFAISHALMYVVTSFGLVYLINYFNSWAFGLIAIIIPTGIGYIWGINHFQKLEEEAKNYP